ncbi:hypothetical protein HHI36_021478 [Cryptolaemus montrouzieri]|uniref:Ionotropic receptor n=1 Tax=Cryptolaemus montrouzieri TaxID=559131 RepID=A0ABD2MWV7_9CUCU
MGVPSGPPDVYIINVDATTTTKFLKFRNKFGFNANTKYIFISRNSSFKFPLIDSDTAIFVNSETGKIYRRSVEENQSEHIGICFEPNNNYTKMFENELNTWKVNEISVCTHIYPPYEIEDDVRKGIDVEILKMTFDLLRIKFKIVVFPYPVGKIDDYLTNMFAKNICDTYSGIQARVLFDFTDPHFYDTLHWVTRTPEEMPRWKYALKNFTIDIWFSCMISTIFLSIVWHLTIFRSKSFKRISNLPQGFLITLKLFLEQSYSSKTSNISQKIMLITILFTSFMINAFYKSRFTYLLSGFNINEPIDSFEAIKANKMMLKIPHSVQQFFEYDPKEIKYLRKYQTVADPSIEIHKLRYEKNTATTLPKRIFYWFINQNLDENMRPTLQIINPPIVFLMSSLILRKNSALTEPLNEKLGYLRDHGHISYILSKYEVLIAERDPTLDVKKLTINHIQLPLILWIFGIIVASGRLYYELEQEGKFGYS